MQFLGQDLLNDPLSDQKRDLSACRTGSQKFGTQFAQDSQEQIQNDVLSSHSLQNDNQDDADIVPSDRGISSARRQGDEVARK